MIDRYATRDVELAGAEIREGDFVEISLAGANRDPAYFPDPDRFDLRRENASSTSPSRTARTSASGCTWRGSRRMTAAERLFDRLPGLRLDPDGPRRHAGSCSASRRRSTCSGTSAI